MSAVQCYVADFNLTPSFPLISELAVRGKPISSYLRQASGDAGIDVSLDYSRRGSLPEYFGGDGVGVEQMMTGVERLLSGAPASASPKIGLLMADSFAPASSQYGLMFDIDGDDTRLGPRQGCAVFLTPIAGVLGTDLTDAASREFVSLIALHEISHAFNLWHIPGRSIMNPNPDPTDLGSLDYDDSQQHFLTLAGSAATSGSVLPGMGCSAYGTRPSGFPAGDSPPFASPPRGKSQLKLKIGLSTTELWPFEPIELDVALSIPRSSKKPLAIADEIDPGHSSFQIWLTRPDGVRLRYQPAVRFCGPNGRRTLQPGQPFFRDIAIGREAGGYTFSVPGVYEVQVAFRAIDDFVMSNVVKCEVRPPMPSSEAWQKAWAALDNKAARRFLQYKTGTSPLKTYADLSAYAASATPQTAAAIEFAVGRALVRAARPVDGTHGRQLLERGRSHLGNALELDCLSAKRRREASALMDGER